MRFWSRKPWFPDISGKFSWRLWNAGKFSWILENFRNSFNNLKWQEGRFLEPATLHDPVSPKGRQPSFTQAPRRLKSMQSYIFKYFFNWNSESLMRHKFLWSAKQKLCRAPYVSRPLFLTLRYVLWTSPRSKNRQQQKTSCKFYCNSVRLKTKKRGDLCLASITQKTCFLQ